MSPMQMGIRQNKCPTLRCGLCPYDVATHLINQRQANAPHGPYDAYALYSLAQFRTVAVEGGT